MKTIQSLKDENQRIIDSFPKNVDRESGEYKKAQKTVGYNNIAIKALETGLTQAKVENDLDKLTSRLQKIADNFEKWQLNTPYAHQTKNPRAKYDKENEVGKLKEQVKFLEFLLS